MTTSKQAHARYRIPRPNMRKVNGLALLVQQIAAAKVELVWTRAHQFQTWDLHEFMVRPPSKPVVQRTRRVLQLSGVLK